MEVPPLLTEATSHLVTLLVLWGVPPASVPLVVIGGGLLLVLWLLSLAGSGDGTLRHAHPAGRSAGAVGGRSARKRAGAAHGSPTPAHGGLGRMDGLDDDEDSPLQTAQAEGAGGREPAPRRWLVDNLVPYGPLPRWRFGFRWPPVWRETRGYITALVGMPGTAKSYLLLAFGIAALTGEPWCGLVARRVRHVLYVDCELDNETFRSRAYAVSRGMGLKKPPRGLHYLSLAGMNGLSLASAEGWQSVDNARRRYLAEAILIDSITIGAFTVTTNDAGAMNRLFGSFEQWGVPVFAIDHLGKDPARGAVGSFMKYAKIRSEVTLRALRRGLIQFSHSKTNFGAQLEPFQVTAQFVGGGTGQGPLTVSFAAVGSGPVLSGSVPLPVIPQGGPATKGSGLPMLANTPGPIPLPVLSPPSADPPHLAWLKAQPDPSVFVDAATIHAAAPGGMTKRRGNEQLKVLWEAGRVERQGTASQGYRYKALLD